jgi:hemin uptake protein HemP
VSALTTPEFVGVLTDGLITVPGERPDMTDTLQIEAGDLSVEEMLAEIEDGRHIIVSTEFLGSEHEVTLRHDGSIYYCDTPTRLHKHEDADEMRTCLRRQGYAADE